MARNTLYPPSVKPGIPRLGEKPKGWSETTFGDILHVLQRPAKIKDNFEYQLVTAKRGRGGIVPRQILTGKKILTKIQYYVAKDDFLISKRQIVHGACGIVPSTLDGALVSGEYSVLRVKEGLLLKYLDYFSHTDYFQMTCFQASVGVDVEKMIFDLKEWLEVKVFLPPVDEQEKIVSILDTWEKAISLNDQVFSANQQLKKGLMQQLFFGNVRFPKFVDLEKAQPTNLGSLPSNWKVKPLRDLCTAILDGTHLTPKYVSKGIHFFSVENVSTNNFTDTKYISEKEHLELIKRCKPEKNDILMTRIGSLGATKLIDWDVNASIYVSLALLKVNKSVIDPLFLYCYTKSEQFIRDLRNRSLLNAIPQKINLGDIGSIPIPVPPISEQQKIAEILHLCDSKIDTINQKIAALRQQKKGLMQKLLTGQIRVKV